MDFLLQEDNTFLLQETLDKIILDAAAGSVGPLLFGGVLLNAPLVQGRLVG
jgi:hypothetical protein